MCQAAVQCMAWRVLLWCDVVEAHCFAVYNRQVEATRAGMHAKSCFHFKLATNSHKMADFRYMYVTALCNILAAESADTTGCNSSYIAQPTDAQLLLECLQASKLHARDQRTLRETRDVRTTSNAPGGCTHTTFSRSRGEKSTGMEKK